MILNPFLQTFLTIFDLTFEFSKEHCLLEKVLEDDLLCSLLASDVWCFMAR